MLNHHTSFWNYKRKDTHLYFEIPISIHQRINANHAGLLEVFKVFLYYKIWINGRGEILVAKQQKKKRRRKRKERKKKVKVMEMKNPLLDLQQHISAYLYMCYRRWWWISHFVSRHKPLGHISSVNPLFWCLLMLEGGVVIFLSLHVLCWLCFFNMLYYHRSCFDL